ncbi:hypothetical protein BGZ60DRAFT_557090 [Tricladium varicosporioides]|nr:hypothetical protein BGZ60DRAFT_557090 [Hymenoscyphus varicosporioides]
MSLSQSTQSLQDRGLAFGSQYYFYPEGVAETRKRFFNALEQSNLRGVTLKWDNEHYVFQLKCHAQNFKAVEHLFREIMVMIITEEEHKNNINLPKTVVFDKWKDSDDDSDASSDGGDEYITVNDVDEDAPIESRLIQHLNAWLAQNREHISASISGTGSSDDTLYPPEITSCKAKSVWRCEDKIDEIASNTVLLELRHLTGCELVKSLNENMVYVGAREEASVHLAITKLDNIQKYANSSIFIGHSFYSEAHKDPLLAFKYILDVKVHKKRIFQMTLLDVNCPQTESHDNLGLNLDYDVLSYALTIRCAPLDESGQSIPYRNMKATPIIGDPKNDSKGQHHRFIFSHKGDPASDPVRLLSGKGGTTAALIDVPAIMQVPKSVASIPRAVTHLPQAMDSIQAAEIARWVIEVPRMNTEPIPPPVGKVIDRDLDMAPIAPKVLPLTPRKIKPSWDTYNERSEDELQNMNAHMVPKKTVPTENMVIKPSMVGKNLPTKASLMDFPSLQPQRPQPQKDRSGNASSSFQKVHKNNQLANVWGNSLDGVLDNQLCPSIALGSSKPSILDDHHSDIFNLSKYIPLPPTRPGVQEQLPPQTMPTPAWESPQISNNQSISELKIEQLVDFNDNETKPSFSNFWLDNSNHPREILQTVDEVRTRRSHSTMNPKVPRPASRNLKNNCKNARGRKENPYKGRLELPSPPPGKMPQAAKPVRKLPDPVPEFCREVSTYYEQLLQGLRGFRGQLTIQAEFGCILVADASQSHVANKYFKDRVVNSQTVASHLGPARHGVIQLSTFFTNRLTTLNSEAEFLVSIKDSQGEPIWESAAYSWNIVYKFLYFDGKTGTFFDIEIDGETFNTQVKAHHGLGCLYIHGTKRHWDFKIEAKGAEILQVEEYSKLASELQRSLYISTDSQEPKLSFVLSNQYADNFDLNGVWAHQISNYRSRDTKSVLQISKVQTLVVGREKTADEQSVVYVCSQFLSTAKPCEIHGWMSTWYEVNISSLTANQLFKQNETLELGNEAAWTIEDISKLNAAQDLYLPACEMLKQMDGIGYHNDNGMDLEKAVGALKEVEKVGAVDFTVLQKKEKFW